MDLRQSLVPSNDPSSPSGPLAPLGSLDLCTPLDPKGSTTLDGNWLSVSDDDYRFEIQDNGRVFQGFGNCTPDECVWEPVPIEKYGHPSSQFLARMDLDWKRGLYVMRRIGADLMEVIALTQFIDNSGRPPYYSVKTFSRSSVEHQPCTLDTLALTLSASTLDGLWARRAPAAGVSIVEVSHGGTRIKVGQNQEVALQGYSHSVRYSTLRGVVASARIGSQVVILRRINEDELEFLFFKGEEWEAGIFTR